MKHQVTLTVEEVDYLIMVLIEVELVEDKTDRLVEMKALHHDRLLRLFERVALCVPYPDSHPTQATIAFGSSPSHQPTDGP